MISREMGEGGLLAAGLQGESPVNASGKDDGQCAGSKRQTSGEGGGGGAMEKGHG